MNKTIFSFTAIVCAMGLPTASAALIAGSDFSDSAKFNAAGGTYDNAAMSTDDLNLTDNITVSGWTFANGGSFQGFDGNAQAGMPNDNVTKINGDGQLQPALGASPAGFASVSFSITIPGGTALDLSSVDWVSRQATGSAARWLAFSTSLDTTLIYSEQGQGRNDGIDTVSVDLTGALYQGLTDQTVTFNWFAGGNGSGDMDFDTPTVNGNVSAIPEPSTALLGLLGGLALLRRRR